MHCFHGNVLCFFLDYSLLEGVSCLLSLSLYVCMRIYTYIIMYVCVCVDEYLGIYQHAYVCVCTYVYRCMCV